MKDEVNSRHWFGNLTVDNIEEVGKVALKMLNGKKYVFAAYHEGCYSVEVRPDRSLENGTNGSPLSVWFGDNREHGRFNFCDTYGGWGLSTSCKKPVYDGKYNTPHVVFEYDKTIKITQRNGHGDLLYWTIAVQD